MSAETKTFKIDLPHVFSELDGLIAFLNSTQGKPVEIDCSGLATMPTKCMQLLLCAEQHWRAQNVSFQVCGIGAECREKLGIVGIPETRFNDEDGK